MLLVYRSFVIFEHNDQKRKQSTDRQKALALANTNLSCEKEDSETERTNERTNEWKKKSYLLLVNCLYFDLVVRFIKTFLIICLMMVIAKGEYGKHCEAIAEQLRQVPSHIHKHFMTHTGASHCECTLVLITEILWDFFRFTCAFFSLRLLILPIKLI